MTDHAISHNKRFLGYDKDSHQVWMEILPRPVYPANPYPKTDKEL